MACHGVIPPEGQKLYGERQIITELERRTVYCISMCVSDQVGACTVARRLLHDRIVDQALAAERLHSEATPVPVLAKAGTNRCPNGAGRQPATLRLTSDALVSFLRELPHGITAMRLEVGPLSNWLHNEMSARPTSSNKKELEKPVELPEGTTHKHLADAIVQPVEVDWKNRLN